jgi:hypothetical protein
VNPGKVPGHALRFEGAPIERRSRIEGRSGVGRGQCQCGATSPTLSTAKARMAWHEQHLDEINREQQIA